MKVSTTLLSLVAAASFGAAPALAESPAWELSLNLPNFALFEQAILTISGPSSGFGYVLIDSVGGPTELLPGLILDIGFSQEVAIIPVTLPPSGVADVPCLFDCGVMTMFLNMPPLHLQAVSVDFSDGTLAVSNSVVLETLGGDGDCNNCGECKGGLTELVMRYLGDTGAFVEVVDLGKQTYFSGYLEPFDVITMVGTSHHNKIDAKNLTFLVDGVEDATMHTSCSKPVGPRMMFGDFYVIAAQSHDNGPICLETPGSGDDCSAGKPGSLEFTYTGGDCSASSHGQDASKATCSGDPAGAATVTVRAYSDKGKVYFEGEVALGASFWVHASAAGGSKLDNNMFIELSDGNGQVLQTVSFHASCSQPVAIGDIYGAMSLTGYVAE